MDDMVIDVTIDNDDSDNINEKKTRIKTTNTTQNTGTQKFEFIFDVPDKKCYAYTNMSKDLPPDVYGGFE